MSLSSDTPGPPRQAARAGRGLPAARPPAPPGTAAPRAHPLLAAPIVPTILKLAGPALVMVLFQISVSIADTYYIGRLGTESLAGFSLVFPLVQLLQMLSGGAMGGGVSSAVARSLGAGDEAGARSVVIHACVIAIVAGLAYTALMLGLGPMMFRLLGGSGRPLELALAYSNLLFAGALFVWLTNTFSSLLRGTGNTVLPALVQMVAYFVHIPVSGALVLGWAGFPAMGIRGAAIAYVCAAGTSALLGAIAVLRPGSRLRPRRRDLRLHREGFVRILRVGGLSALSALQNVLGALLLTGIIGRYGTAALAGYGVGVRLELLMMSVVFAFGQALVPMVGTAVGAGNDRRAKRAAFIGAAMGALPCGLLGLAVSLHPAWWTTIFSSDAAVLATGALYLHWVGPVYVLLAMGAALYFASQGAGRVLWPVLSASARLVVILLGGSLLTSLGAPLWAVCALAATGILIYGVMIIMSVYRTRWAA